MNLFSILQIGGFRMRLPATTPAAGYWALKARLEALATAVGGVAVVVTQRECKQNLDGKGPTAVELAAADGVVVYSYAMATMKALLHGIYDLLAINKKKFRLLAAIAGVPDVPGELQIGGWAGALWHVEEFFEQAVFFNVDVIPPSPVSYPIRDAGALNISIEQLEAALAGAAGGGEVLLSARRINVDCNSLVAGLDVISKHTAIQDHPRVLAAIEKLFARALGGRA